MSLSKKYTEMKDWASNTDAETPALVQRPIYQSAEHKHLLKRLSEQPGTKFCVIGYSGMGKSTLCHELANTLPNTLSTLWQGREALLNKAIQIEIPLEADIKEQMKQYLRDRADIENKLKVTLDDIKRWFEFDSFYEEMQIELAPIFSKSETRRTIASKIMLFLSQAGHSQKEIVEEAECLAPECERY